MPLREIVIGRDEEDREKYGKRGTIYLGRHLVGKGEDANLTNPVHMDVARPHVMIVCGKRGAGKCLLPRENIQLANGNLKEIQEVYEENKDNGKKIINKKDEKLIKLKKKPKIISLDKNLKTKTNYISHLYKKKVNENLIKIETRTGKKIIVTKEHPILNSELKWEEAEKIEVGSFIAIPSKIKTENIPEKLKIIGKRVNYPIWSQRKGKILTILSNNGGMKGPDLKNNLKFDPYKKLNQLSDIGLINSKTNSPTVYSLTEKGKKFVSNLEEGNFYRNRESSKPIKLSENNEKLAKFMAYIIAEGNESNTGNSFRFLFANSSQQMKEDFENLCNDLFSLTTKKFKDGDTLYFDSLNLKDFLEINKYNCGRKSGKKEIPEFILKNTDKNISKFLQTFFDCEGYISKVRPEIELSSKSKKLINQVSYMLLRFGIQTIVTKKVKYASNTEEKKRRRYYFLKISGKENLRKFRDFINSKTKNKNKRLETHLQKNSNPNLDILPNVGNKIREVRENLQMNRTDMKIKKQSIKAYEEGKYKPTKAFLNKRLKTFKKRIKTLNELYNKIKKNKNPDLIIEVVESTFLEWKEINKKMNTSYSGKNIFQHSKYRKGKEFEKIRKLVLDHLEKIINNKELENKIELLERLIKSDVFWDKVTSIQKLPYSGWVYDLTVPENHNFIAGENGGIVCHNSYTGAVITEEMCRLPEDVRKNLAVLMIDPMGIYWSLKNPNEKQYALLKEWGIQGKSFEADVYVPKGFEEEYRESDIPFDKTYSIKPSSLTTEDWALAFGIDLIEPLGILLGRIIGKLKEGDYTLQDIINRINTDERASKRDREGLENLFLSAKDWGIFSERGTKIKELLSPGKVSILDVSRFGQVARGWSVRTLLLGLLTRRIYKARVAARRKEEKGTIEGRRVREVPLTWIIMDEAHNFVPSGTKVASSDPLIRVVKEGRQPGISTIFITQRPNKLHEDVIAQSDLVLSHRLTARPDLQALRNIMQTYMLFDIQKYINELPRRKGAAIVLDDNSERIYSLQVRPRMSWHAGGTPIALEEEEEFGI